MLSADFVIATAIAYVCLLFVLAYFGDRRARENKNSWLNSPAVYTLSISVYCTSWTFYGAVGNAARSGLEFMTIYLGPTLVFVGWYFLLRRLVRISHLHRITSLADLLSSRFGKSSRLGVLVTCIAVVGIAPYIALQLKAVTSSIQAVAGSSEFGQGSLKGIDDVGLAFGVAAGMALFTILFGTRHVDAKEQHHGVVAAIAFEAVVKLTALVAVGVFVVYIGGGFEGIFRLAAERGLAVDTATSFDSRWLTTMGLSIAAIVCLPRQFQVTVVENSNENHLRVAGWAFPAYMMAMSIFILPIAVYGLAVMPDGSNPDMFALTLPLAAGQNGLALFAFIGGFSSATSMIILESIALSIMVSNHIIMPLVLKLSAIRQNSDGQGVTRVLLIARRVSIVLILSLGFFYFFFTRDSDALAPIGLISFTAIAQFFPALLAAIFWRDASLKAVTAAIAIGFVFWAWCCFLPSFDSVSPAVSALLDAGPWGISWLRPEAMFGLQNWDPLAHAAFWSLSINVLVLVIGSLITSPSALERIQATAFVDVFRHSGLPQRVFAPGSATANDLFFVAERVLGERRAAALFEMVARERGVDPVMMDPTPEFVAHLERELAGSIGAASAHVMLSKVVAGADVSLEEMMQMADETQQAKEYSQRLEKTSQELRLTAQKLEDANMQLRELDSQKDEFLSQVSHEVRTPMTSIRSFSEILLEPGDLNDVQRHRFVTTIHQESLRLTKLLDEILDLSALERGERAWENVPVDADAALNRALTVCDALLRQKGFAVEFGERSGPAMVEGDADRLCQVFINLIANAVKYNDADQPRLRVTAIVWSGHFVVDISDNGPGIPKDERTLIFEKFARGLRGSVDQTGAGLGLAISRQIVTRMNGTLELAQGSLPGACFRLRLPVLPKK
ncbi:MAG: sodium:solute symporter [Devosia sp.]|jgi:Na+/proline symporter/nitrogen-specific signal transduction histidine kinase|uniref:sensor histidine kinase n=1 Tax=unclassified Devosia TaxID=196773 RepID=UPI001A000CD4|nr:MULTISPECIES: sensor histidine kinase [unclassified Devosia]MBF0678150.1 sodium:solute symporter [Devosia sp.]WEJ31410.1 sensor histidine kinase [Devosia sp. SD17-2]